MSKSNWRSYEQLLASVYGFEYSHQDAKSWMNKRAKLQAQIKDCDQKFWKIVLNPKGLWVHAEKLLDRENDLRDELAILEGFTLC